MTGLMTIFLVIGAIGLIFLLISLVVGDVFEALGFDFGLDASHDFGVFDSRVIAVFLNGVRRFRCHRRDARLRRVWRIVVRFARRRGVRRDCFLFRKTALQPAIFEFGQHGKFNRAHGAGHRRHQARRARTNFLPRR